MSEMQGRERPIDTPLSEDPSPTIPSHRKEEEKRKKSRIKNEKKTE